MRSIAAMLTPNSTYHVRSLASSARPECPRVTREAIATTMPVKKPMPSACNGARPRKSTPVTNIARLCTV
jgi:hypothetical protein